MQASEKFELIYRVIAGELDGAEVANQMDKQLVLDGMED